MPASLPHLSLDYAYSFLNPRARDAYKGDFGHVLIIGGDYGMGGAVRLAGEAALRVGAGLVSVATHADHRVIVNAGRPEIMCHAVRTEEDLEPLLKKATVVVIGPGLGRTQWGKDLFDAVVGVNVPIVCDADALRLLAASNRTLPQGILTPHIGEAATLLDWPIPAIQADRLKAAHTIYKQYLAICVLKGAGTFISGEKADSFCNLGNPGLAGGGSGDVLSGIIAGMLAQAKSFSISNQQATEIGVILHAAAADCAAKEGERGQLASDLMPFIRKVANKL